VIQNEPVLVSDDLDAAAQTFLDNVEDSSGELSDGINGEQETVRGEIDAFRVVNEDDEINVIDRRLGLSDVFVPSMYKSTRWHTKLEIVASAGLKFVDLNQKCDEKKISSDVSGDLFARMFPHLFRFPWPPRGSKIGCSICSGMHEVLHYAKRAAF
jgi:hypothetical protein